MLIVALVLAVVGLAALVTAVVTSNELVAWVCIAASALGVLLLIVDAIRERQQRRQGDVLPSASGASTDPDADADADTDAVAIADYPEGESDVRAEEIAAASDVEPGETTGSETTGAETSGEEEPGAQESGSR